MSVNMTEEQIDFVTNIYQNTQNMIVLADSKANTVLTIQSLLISITIGTSIVVDVFQKIKSINLGFSIVFYILLISLVICSLLGIGFSIFVFKARGCTDETEASRNGLIYFGHVTNFKKSSDYLEQISELKPEKILQEYSSQIFQISFIAKEKMKYVNKAVTCLIINVVLAIFILLITGYVSVH
jgi:hypothetical protein